jgi:xanthine dehydrogenase accessory factor
MPRVVDFTGTIRSLAERREPFVVATVVRTLGSSLGKPGFKAVVSKDGRILYGAVGGACPESAIATMAMDALRSGQARVVKVFRDDMNRALEGNLKSSNPDEVHVETNCGGMMEIYVDPYVPADRLIIVGHGGKDPVEEALVKSGKALGFETVVIDHLPVLSEDPDTLITDLDYDLGPSVSRRPTPRSCSLTARWTRPPWRCSRSTGSATSACWAAPSARGRPSASSV